MTLVLIPLNNTIIFTSYIHDVVFRQKGVSPTTSEQMTTDPHRWLSVLDDNQRNVNVLIGNPIYK